MNREYQFYSVSTEDSCNLSNSASIPVNLGGVIHTGLIGSLILFRLNTFHLPERDRTTPKRIGKIAFAIFRRGKARSLHSKRTGNRSPNPTAHR